MKVKEVRPLFDDCVLRVYKNNEDGKIWEGVPSKPTPYDNEEIDFIAGAWEPGDDKYINYFGIYIK